MCANEKVQCLSFLIVILYVFFEEMCCLLGWINLR